MSKKLTRCDKGLLFGVCCGIAKFLDIDVSLVRILFILGIVCTGSLLFWIYLVLSLIVPVEES